MARKLKSSSEDERTVDIEDDYAIYFWTREFSVNQTRLRAAVEAVGSSVTAVRRELKK